MNWLRRLLVVILGCVLAAIIAVPLLVDHFFSSAGERMERRKAEASAQVERHTREYAEAVLAGKNVPTDRQLTELTYQRGLTVYEIDRRPELTVLLEAQAPYGHLFGVSYLRACYRLAFHEIGGLAARVDRVALPSCPTTPPTHISPS